LKSPFSDLEKTNLILKKKSRRNIFLKKKVCCIYGKLYIKKTYNNMFLTTVDSFTGNVIASFSSKMFKAVEGKRQSFALILLKKLGFIVGLKTLIKRYFDLQVVFFRRLRRSRLRALFRGLHKSGIKFRKFITLRRLAHNGSRGRVKRRV